MSSGEELRRAANLLLERSEAATPGPWQHMCLGTEGCLVLRNSGTVRERGRGRVAVFRYKDWKPDHADAEFVAGMDPVAGAALARLLAELAEHADHGSQGALVLDALEVARAILGTTESAAVAAGEGETQ